MKRTLLISLALIAMNSCGNKQEENIADEVDAVVATEVDTEQQPAQVYSPEELNMMASIDSLIGKDGTSIGRYHIGDVASRHLPYASTDYVCKDCVIDSTIIKTDHFKVVATFTNYDAGLAGDLLFFKCNEILVGQVNKASDESKINEISCHMYTDPHIQVDTIAARFEDVFAKKGYVLKRKTGPNDPDEKYAIGFIKMEKGDTVVEIDPNYFKNTLTVNMRTHNHERKIEFWDSARGVTYLKLNELDSIPRSECPVR